MLKDPSERLRRAIKDNNLYLVRRIIERNTVDTKDPSGPPDRNVHRFDIRNTDPVPRYTSLAWAAVSGHEEIFEYLLNMGHDEEELSRDAENNTILILLAGIRNASNTASQGREYDMQATALRMARIYQERYPYLIDWSNVHGKTALHVAATKGNEEFVRMFCDLGADFDLPDLQGNTPLHYASAWNHVSVLQLLIERGCQFAARNNEGFTASDYAFSFNTMNTLQETARAQFENNKRARRHIFAQAAARGVEREGRDPAAPSSSRDDRQGTTEEDLKRPAKINPDDMRRFRSGSGGSRTTASASDGDGSLPPSTTIPPPPSKLPLSSSASFPVSQPGQPLLMNLVTGGSNTGASKTGLQSATSQTPVSPQPPRPPHSTTGSLSLPPRTSSNGAHTISPVASRMRDRDADAMAEYMKRTRSGSNGTSTMVESRIGPSASTPAISAHNGGPPAAQSAAAPPSASPTERRTQRELSRERPPLDAAAVERDGERGSEIMQNSVFRPLRRLRPSNSAASLRPTGIIGMPSGVSSHGHSNSAVEIDLIKEVLHGMQASENVDAQKSFLPALSPIETSPVSSIHSPVMAPTRPLDIKPRQKANTLENGTVPTVTPQRPQPSGDANPTSLSSKPSNGNGEVPRPPPIAKNGVTNGGSGHRRVQDSR